MFGTLWGVAVHRWTHARQPARRTPAHHRRIAFEPLEDRRVLSIIAPQAALFGVTPALFVENQGQWTDEAVRFLHQGDGANVAMTDEGVTFEVYRRAELEGAEADRLGMRPGDRPPSANDLREALQFSAEFVGAHPVAPIGLEPSGTVFNYFTGDAPTWRSAVPGYEVVAYEGLYAGIDLHTRGLRSSLKYEFHVSPGADW